MADSKTTALSGFIPVLTDLVYGVDDPGGTPVSGKLTLTAIRDLLQANIVKATISPADDDNAVVISGSSLTGSDATSLLDLSQTWNTTGTPTAIKLDVTDTASNASSLLMDLQVGSTSQFSVSKSGAVTMGSILQGGNVFKIQGNSYAYMQVRDSDGTFLFRAGNKYTLFITDNRVFLGNDTQLAWCDGNPHQGSADTVVVRDAANTLALRNSTNAQTFNVYNTYTDGSNYERLAIGGASLTVETAGTGTDNIDLTLTPAGTGVVQFGSHTAIGSETVTGYITIKDSGGTSRKLAVVS